MLSPSSTAVGNTVSADNIMNCGLIVSEAVFWELFNLAAIVTVMGELPTDFVWILKVPEVFPFLITILAGNVARPVLTADNCTT